MLNSRDVTSAQCVAFSGQLRHWLHTGGGGAGRRLGVPGQPLGVVHRPGARHLLLVILLHLWHLVRRGVNTVY